MGQELPDFETLFEALFGAVFRYCVRLTGDADHAEDVAQEAFVRLITHEVSGPLPAVKVWLFKVATHLVRDHVRVAENRRRLLTLHPVAPTGGLDAHGALERSERIDIVRAALATLSERDRTMLLMREEGFSYHEIADVVDVRSTSVGTLLARAQKRLANALRHTDSNADEA